MSDKTLSYSVHIKLVFEGIQSIMNLFRQKIIFAGPPSMRLMLLVYQVKMVTLMFVPDVRAVCSRQRSRLPSQAAITENVSPVLNVVIRWILQTLPMVLTMRSTVSTAMNIFMV